LLITELLHLLIADAVAEKYGAAVHEQSGIEIVLSYICANYRNHITLDKLADLAHLNKSYLVRLFRREVGMSPIEYLIDVRIKNAMKLLAMTDMKLSDIAESCGWSDCSFFIRQFKHKTGVTPYEYKKSSTV
jgi:AraC-like DNA-binding protein